MIIRVPHQTLVDIFHKLIQIATNIDQSLRFEQLSTNDEEIIISIQMCIGFLHKQIVAKSLTPKKEAKIDVQMYELIESELQKQEGINRSLIKRQLQGKQYQKCLMEELNDQKKINKKLQNEINKFNESSIVHHKDDFLLSKQRKSTIKDQKNLNYFTFDTILNEKKIPPQLVKIMLKESKTSYRTHQRGRSEQYKKSGTATNKKKNLMGSQTKR